jgi:hypothetical protein
LGNIAWKASGGSDIRVSLHTGYTPNQDTHTVWTDVSASECPATGNYSAGGATLAMSDATVDTGTNETRMDSSSATLVWSSSTISATHAIIHKYNATGSLDLLLGYVDFGGTVVSSNGTFTITWDTDAILKITAA